MTDRAKEIAIQLDYISTSILHTMADLYDYPNLHTTNVYKLKNALKYVIDNNNTDIDIPKSYLDLIEEAMKIYNSLYNIHPPQQYNIHQLATAINQANQIQVPPNVITGIKNKVKEAIKETFTPTDTPTDTGLSKAQQQRELDNLRKLNKLNKK